MWVQSLSWEDHLEEEMATHSRILACGIPWTEEPDGLEPMGSQRVRHNLVTGHIHTDICHSFPSKEQVSFNFMVTVTVYSNLGAQENSLSLFSIFPLMFAMK